MQFGGQDLDFTLVPPPSPKQVEIPPSAQPDPGAAEL
jgi:hypothetical protein